MIECSNCKELIGDNMEQCPFCLHPVSEEVRAAYMEKQEEVKAIQEVMKSYASRVRKSIIIGIVIAVIDLFCFLFFVCTDTFTEYAFFICCVLTLIVCIVPSMLITCCPYCKKGMGVEPDALLSMSYCPRCGGQLR